MNQATLQKYLDCLPATITEIMASAHCQRETVYLWLGRLQHRGLAHISRWQANAKGPSSAVYVAGPGKCVPRPAPTTNKNMARYLRTRQPMNNEDMVMHAIRTQPNSVFELGEYV